MHQKYSSGVKEELGSIRVVVPVHDDHVFVSRVFLVYSLTGNVFVFYDDVKKGWGEKWWN